MLKVRTMFSGIGSPESALKNIGIEYDLVDFCEIDKFAIEANTERVLEIDGF